jgi:hypothetical protein
MSELAKLQGLREVPSSKTQPEQIAKQNNSSAKKRRIQRRVQLVQKIVNVVE